MFEALILIFTCSVVYGISWTVAWLVRKVITLPGWLVLPWLVRKVITLPGWLALPWLLFQVHLVVGLLITGELSGSGRAVVMIAGVMALLSIVPSLTTWFRRRGSMGLGQTLGAHLGAGIAPWVVALGLASL